MYFNIKLVKTLGEVQVEVMRWKFEKMRKQYFCRILKILHVAFSIFEFSVKNNADPCKSCILMLALGDTGKFRNFAKLSLWHFENVYWDVIQAEYWDFEPSLQAVARKTWLTVCRTHTGSSFSILNPRYSAHLFSILHLLPHSP